MTSLINNFVAFRKNKGDVLDRTSFRTVVEMVNGIIERYDYEGFNAAYQSFLNHLLNYNDPHHVTETSFLAEIIARTYVIYTKMTPTPVSEAMFNSDIVPSVEFLELIRRIVLNRYLYDKVKNNDGSVPETKTVSLSRDWGHTVSGSQEVTLSFGSGIANEDDFITRGWNGNTTPVQAIFTAEDIDLSIPRGAPIFHTSKSSPHFLISDDAVPYMVTLFGSSNDLILQVRMSGSPVLTASVVALMNGTDTFTVTMSSSRSVQLLLNGTPLGSEVACSDGAFVLRMSHKGLITLLTQNDSIFTSTTYNADFSSVDTFISGTIYQPLERDFVTGFAIQELTICKDIPNLVPEDTPIPVIFHVPVSGVSPVTGAVSATGNSAQLIARAGYQIYLTLTGTWVGTATLMVSHDDGVTWNPVTAYADSQLGIFTQNCDEAIVIPRNNGNRYRLRFQVDSGTITYRLAQ